jgi:large subunit ribosomal protein L3
VPVTVIEVGPCVVLQRKSTDKEGYGAVQVGFGDQKEHRVSKAALARFKKAGCAPKRHLKEFRLDADEDLQPGHEVTAAIFDGVGYVDVVGITKGRGFQGVVKRHGMAGGRMTHGGGSKRRVGAIGQCAYPGRVAKGQRMPGRMGRVRVTQRHLKIVSLRPEENLLLVRGAVPGPNGGIVTVRKSLKVVS